MRQVNDRIVELTWEEFGRMQDSCSEQHTLPDGSIRFIFDEAVGVISSTTVDKSALDNLARK